MKPLKNKPLPLRLGEALRVWEQIKREKNLTLRPALIAPEETASNQATRLIGEEIQPTTTVTPVTPKDTWANIFQRSRNCVKCRTLITYNNVRTYQIVKNQIRRGEKVGCCKPCQNILQGVTMSGRQLSEETRHKISVCNKGRKLSETARYNISQAKLGDKNPMRHYVFSPAQIELKSKIASGRKHSEEVKLRLSICKRGKRHTEDTKKRLGIQSRLRIWTRLHILGIEPAVDTGATEWFNEYNVKTNSSFTPTLVRAVGYHADGYDSNKHIWIEYDTEYHKRRIQKQKDKIRQNKIIRYFEDIGEPLVAFKRVLAYDNMKVVTVYSGAYGV